MAQYRTRQKQAFADATKKRKAENKARPASAQEIDKMLFGLGRRSGFLDGYTGPEEMGEDMRRFLNKKIGL